MQMVQCSNSMGLEWRGIRTSVSTKKATVSSKGPYNLNNCKPHTFLVIFCTKRCVPLPLQVKNKLDEGTTNMCLFNVLLTTAANIFNVLKVSVHTYCLSYSTYRDTYIR